MIYDQPEHFGPHEKRITEKEKEEITLFLKYDKHVPLRMAENVFHGEVDSLRFKHLGIAGGIFMSSVFFVLPVIRGLPIKQRLFWAALPGFGIYKQGLSIQDELGWNRTYSTYQKYQVHHAMHRKIFV